MTVLGILLQIYEINDDVFLASEAFSFVALLLSPRPLCVSVGLYFAADGDLTPQTVSVSFIAWS